MSSDISDPLTPLKVGCVYSQLGVERDHVWICRLDLTDVIDLGAPKSNSIRVQSSITENTLRRTSMANGSHFTLQTETMYSISSNKSPLIDDV